MTAPKKTIVQNRRARHNYFIEDTYEAGIELFGTEVKSIRLGNVNFKDAYCTIKNGELFVVGMHISPYEKGNIFNREPERTRRLLMHKGEIRRLDQEVRQSGWTLVPLSLYFSKSRVKMELALARGKKTFDKRETIRARDISREMDKTIKERY